MNGFPAVNRSPLRFVKDREVHRNVAPEGWKENVTNHSFRKRVHSLQRKERKLKERTGKKSPVPKIREKLDR